MITDYHAIITANFFVLMSIQFRVTVRVILGTVRARLRVRSGTVGSYSLKTSIPQGLSEWRIMADKKL